MPSPFPGMDPYLEHPVLWPSLQQYFASYLSDNFRDVLPRHYEVRVQERTYYDNDCGIDVDELTKALSAQRSQQRGCPIPSAEITVPWHIPCGPEEVHEFYVEICESGRPDVVLTAVELISPATKTPGSCARKLYRQQQKTWLQQNVHVLEIDLLRRGAHAVLAPKRRLLRRGSYDYLTCLSRACARQMCEVWAMDLRNRLPRIPLPLDGNDPDVVLDLQAVVDQCYDLGGFAACIDYSRDPYYPLSPTMSSWARQVLRGPAGQKS